MRVLLSAYACEPGRGSEPEVGWRWAIELAECGHQVWVLTRANNRVVIEKEEPATRWPNLHFEYFDLSDTWLWLKRVLGVNAYYHAWQLWATRVVEDLHKQWQFDVVHHVTFVVARHPSCLRVLGNSGVPFVFGPVAGGECVPPGLLGGTPLGFRLVELVRPLLNRIVMLAPSVRRTLDAAQRIVVTSPQTMALLPKHARPKATVALAISLPAAPVPARPRRLPAGRPVRALFVGRFVALKGAHLALHAIADARRQGLSIELTLVGGGPQQDALARLAQEIGLGDCVTLLPWCAREQLDAVYEGHDLLLFPSMRDSGGLVVLEALAHGLPVVCLKLGGPGVVVDDSCGEAVIASSTREAIRRLAEALDRVAGSPSTYEDCSRGAIARARRFDPKRLMVLLGYSNS